MRKLSLVTLLVTSIASIGIARADISTVPVDDKAALDFYKNSQLVISKSTVNPFELAGCLVLHKDGQVDQYLNVLPGQKRDSDHLNIRYF